MDDLQKKILNYTLNEQDLDQEDDLLERKTECMTSKFYDAISLKYSILNSIWTEIGLPKTKLEERINELNEIINESLTNILENVIEEEDNTFNKLRVFKKKKLIELNNFLEDLGLNKFDLNYKSSLLVQIKTILLKLEEINAIKLERFEKWNFCLKRFEQLNLKMNLNVEIKYEKSVPTLFEIEELEKKINLNQKMLEKYEKMYSAIQPEIVKLFDQLEIEPSSDFERIVLNNRKNEFIFNKSNFEMLHELKNKLIQKIEQNKIKFLELKQNYINLSKLIFIKQDDIDRFLILNGEKLSKLEVEYNKLNSKYEQNREIYDKINNWIQDAHELNKLNKSTNDPNRFKNRGCKLLKDEQKRNYLRKQLNKLEYDIKLLISNWSIENNDENFLIYEYNVFNYFEKLRTDLHLFVSNNKKPGITFRFSNNSPITTCKKNKTLENCLYKSTLHNVHKTIRKESSTKMNLNYMKSTLKKNKENAFDISSLMVKLDEIDQSSKLKLDKLRLPLTIKSNLSKN